MAVELGPISSISLPRHDEDNEDQDTLTQSLPQPDNGREAWSFLLGAFIIEALLWGFPLAFGVFQDYYSKHPSFTDDPRIAVVGTIATSIYFLGAPLATPLVKRFHRHQRHMIVVGWLVCVVSLVAASFCTSVPGLIATQGAGYGLGFAILYFPTLSMLNEWFVRRRGLAYGVMFAGSGLSGTGFPFMLQALLSRYGYQTTLRVVAVAQFVVVAPSLPLLKGRLPPSGRGRLRVLDMSFLKQPLFYCFAISNLFHGLGYYIPSLYLPSYASMVGFSGTVGALILAANNLATTGGQVILGHLLDRSSNVLLLVSLSALGSSVATFTLWGFSDSLALLMTFALVYGLLAGSFPIFWVKFGSMLTDDPAPVYGMMAFGKGLGNVLTGPVTAPLLTGPLSSGYGRGKYEPVIIFLGSCMLCSSMAIFGWPLQRRLR